jgi:hypothetical protein
MYVNLFMLGVALLRGVDSRVGVPHIPELRTPSCAIGAPQTCEFAVSSLFKAQAHRCFLPNQQVLSQRHCHGQQDLELNHTKRAQTALVCRRT